MVTWLCMVSLAWAQQARLLLSKDEVEVGQTVRLQIVLQQASGRPPILSAGDGFTLRYVGQESSTEIVNMRTSKTVRYNYDLTALEAGTYTLGPLSIPTDQGALDAPALTFTVAPRADDEGQGAENSLSDTRPYLGELVLYSFQAQLTGNVLELGWSPPSFDGFRQEATVEPSMKRESFVQDGSPAIDVDITIPLVASGEGRRTVSPGSIQVETARQGQRGRSRMDMMMGLTERERTTFAARPIDVEVRPLPQPPPEFSGLVGRFDLQVTAAARRVPLGESVTLQMRLEGDGSLAGLTLPTPDWPGFRVYDQEPVLTASLDADGFHAAATLDRVVVPEAEGQQTIPPVELVVFDPAAERYITLRSAPVAIEVVPGEGAVEVERFGSPTGPAGVVSLGEDILPPPGGARVRDRRLASAMPWAGALALLPALAWVALLVLGRTPHDADPRRSLHKSLSALPVDPQARQAALERTFRAAVALRVACPEGSVDRQRVSALGPDALALFDALERARYGGVPEADLEPRVRAFVEAT